MKNITLVIAMALGCCAGSAPAQLLPPQQAPRPVTDPKMIVDDRGQKLELFRTVRATPELASGSGTVIHRLRVSKAEATFSPQSLGVVYNHSTGVQGFVTGEISFSPVGSSLPDDITPESYPGLRKIVQPDVYEVVARTPDELLALLTTLKARTDLKWVELYVNYGVSSNSVLAVLDAAKKKAPASAGKK